VDAIPTTFPSRSKRSSPKFELSTGWLDAPCYDFDIDPAHERDTVFIRDDGITRATLEITAPLKGEHFATGQNITIDCTAIDIDGAITSIDFYADDQKIGESHLYFFVEPPPGTPIMHTFTWTGAPVGTHALTTRATSSVGTPIVSAPVSISVGGNQVPHVQITSPGGRRADSIRHAGGDQCRGNRPRRLYEPRRVFRRLGGKLGELRLDFRRAAAARSNAALFLHLARLPCLAAMSLCVALEIPRTPSYLGTRHDFDHSSLTGFP
jgi:hypothetical protein